MLRGRDREHAVDQPAPQPARPAAPAGRRRDPGRSSGRTDSSTRLSVVLTPCPPGPDERLNRQAEHGRRHDDARGDPEVAGRVVGGHASSVLGPGLRTAASVATPQRGSGTSGGSGGGRGRRPDLEIGAPRDRAEPAPLSAP